MTSNAWTVTFQVKNGSTNVGSAVTSSAVSGCNASVTSSLPATLSLHDALPISTYNGSSNFNGSSDSSASLTVGARNTTTVANNASSTYSENARAHIRTAATQ